MAEGEILVLVRWAVNPFRGDKFEEAWLPSAEAALDYGATSWSLYRNSDGRLDFIQTATFPNKADWDRYWYSEEIAQARENLQGWFQIPLLPTYWEISGSGSLSPAPAEPS